MHTDQVAEAQGLYGPFTLSERVIQKIWLRQDFASTNLKTVSGRTLMIKDPGRWNLHEGPDFKEAKLVLDDVEVVGDVEVHFDFLDWRHHRHDTDENYDRVVLHVVLYPGVMGDPASHVQTSKGYVPELLYLMPLLDQDLESYAMEDALMQLEQQDELEWVARFVEKPLEVRVQLLNQKARERWRQKRRYARQRLQAGGWENACHQYALEVLGYKRNRSPMLRLAARYPLVQLRAAKVEHRTVHSNQVEESESLGDTMLIADRLFDEESMHWKLNGLRPANHPRRRLAQYLEIVAKQPYWPDQLADCLKAFPAVSGGGETVVFRKAFELSRLRTELSKSVFCSVIGEKRLNTLIVDAILPLATAAGLLDGIEYWLNWFPGDCPDALSRFLRQALVINRKNPLCNGFNQGALALFLEGGIGNED